MFVTSNQQICCKQCVVDSIRSGDMKPTDFVAIGNYGANECEVCRRRRCYEVENDANR